MESRLLEGLNPSQVAAATLLEGPLLILAGPGSGKTRVITHRIAYMIEQGIEPSHIAALTFTNKAAGEMRQRLERIVGVNDVWLGTFHGFCVRLLRRYARLVGLSENFSIYDTDDAQAALLSAVNAAKFELSHTTLGKLAARVSYFKNRLVTPEILEAEALSSEEYQVGQVYPHYQRIMLENNAVDFDDILMHVATLLRSHSDLRSELDQRFRYIMVDEYQDTNLAQYVIIRHLSVDYPNLAATGDPDQSIYGWRGANLKNVTNLERDYPELRILRLEENYRSTPEILSVADHLIQHNQYRKAKTLVPLRSVGHRVRLSIYPTARQEAEDIADQIAGAVRQQEGGEEYTYGDFGVLYRTNANSRLIEQALARRQIPYQLIGGFRFYARKEVKDLVAYLLLVNNPDDNVALERAINTPARGIGKQTLEKLRELAVRDKTSLLEAVRRAVTDQLLSKRARVALASFVQLYEQLCAVSHGGLLELLQLTLELTGYREHMLKQARGEEDDTDILENLDELLAEAHELDQMAHDDRSALELFLEVSALQADSDRLKHDADLVTLMTLHAAKGLEFRCVHLIAVEENILPHFRSKDDPLSLEEERRLLFVGITRAKDQLQLSYAKSRGFSGQGSGVPSSFLVELPRGELQIDDRTDLYQSDYGRDDYDSNAYTSYADDWYDEASSGASEEAGCDQVEQPYAEYDDACQLPPDELSARIKRRQRPSGTARILTGAEFAELSADEDPWSEYRTGCIVVHPNYGPGEIVSASGHGPKRSVTIKFFSTSSRRTFRLSHTALKIQR